MESDLVPFRRIVLLAAALALLAVGLLPSPAIAAPTAELTVPASVSFPTSTVGGVVTEQVSLKNNSEAGVNVDEVKIEGVDSGDFGIEGTNCVGFIGPSMGCVLTVRFSPGGAGPREATLRVSTDGTPSEYSVELSGEGAAPEVVFEPGSHDFGLVEAHTGGARTNFTVRNAGAAGVQLGNLEISGPDANEFWIPGSGCWGTTLTPGSTCGVEVQFNANQEGDFAAALRVTAGNVTFEAPLTARAERPQVTASPAPLAFGPTGVGSRQVKQVTLTNTGHLPVAFFISLVSGGDIGSFDLVEENCTSNVFAGQPRIFEPGESCAAKIAFEPKDAGAKAATVSFFGVGEGALQVSLQGEAVAPQLSLTPSSRDFGSAAVGTAGPVQTFQLRNESAEAQAIDSAVLTGPDLGEFQVRSDECPGTTLAPGGSCTVAVRFAPETTGAKSATLRLRGGGAGAVASLAGEGTAVPGSSAADSARLVPRGRVALDLKLRPRPVSGGVTIGRARCLSSQPCVLRLNGYVSGQAVRGLRVSTLRIAPGASASVTAPVPQELRAPSARATLRISLRWRTGPERGGADRSFRLGESYAFKR